MASASKGFESNDSDDEEEEPKLKYERIVGDLRDILRKDGASCMYVNDKLLILGTNWGKIHVFDHQGNCICQFNYHSGPVTMVSMDAQGDFLASCSHDKKGIGSNFSVFTFNRILMIISKSGSTLKQPYKGLMIKNSSDIRVTIIVVIQGLYSNETSYSFVLDSSIRCVAIEPNYSKAKSRKRFIVGTNQLIAYEKALFGSVKPSVLFEVSSSNCEVVRNMRWGGQFLAFAVDSAVRVMDMEIKTVISLIKRDHSQALGCDQYPPHICWQDNFTLLIGWGDSVKVCRVRERAFGSSSIDLPPYYVEIAFMFTTDFYVCGIGPLDQLVVVLAYNKTCNATEISNAANSEWRRPQMRVLLPLQKTYEELSKDVLGIRCYQDYQPFNYHLEHLSEDRRFYIVCPQDVVVAKPREPQDRIQWLLEHERFQEALEVVENCGGTVSHYTVLNVGQSYIEHLMEEGSFKKAAQLAPKVAGDDRMLWELIVDRFHCLSHLKELSRVIPTGPPGPLLSNAIYQTVLADLLKKDHQTFLDIVKVWPKNLYNVSVAISNVLEVLARNASNMTLLRALAHLYSNIEKHDKALAIYLKLKHKDVFGLINRHSLFFCVAKHVVELMTLDVEATLVMCSLHISVIDPSDVVEGLVNNLDFLYKYLDRLYEEQKDYSAPFHNRLLQLYAVYDKTKIMPLLMSSAHIDLDPALQVVQTHCMIPETVYLLIRMGSSESALKIVLQEENDLDWAIRICQQHSDQDLWRILIEHSIDKPEYIRILLNNMGAHVDPLLILQRIPENLEIPGLRDALTKIMHDYELRISLQNGYQKILIGDCIKLLQKQLTTQSSGISVTRDGECCMCQQKLVRSKLCEDSELVVFGCRHIYHSKCIAPEQPDYELCVACTSKKVVPSSVT